MLDTEAKYVDCTFTFPIKKKLNKVVLYKYAEHTSKGTPSFKTLSTHLNLDGLMNIPLKSGCRALYLNNESAARHENKLVSIRLLTSHYSLLFLGWGGGGCADITENAQCIQHFCNRSFLMSSNIDKQEAIMIMQGETLNKGRENI